VELGMNGVVLGILTAERRVDIERTRELVEVAHPLPVTFHRVFDAATDRDNSLKEVIQTGAARILTSGGANTAMEGRTQPGRARSVRAHHHRCRRRHYRRKCRSHRERDGAAEFHAGLSSVFLGVETAEQSFEEEVRKLAKQLVPHPHRQGA